MTDESDFSSTWGEQLACAERLLAEAGTPAPQEEAAELLGYLLGMPVSLLATLPAVHMRPLDVQKYAAWTARRAMGEPMPYITGHLEFMGLDITTRRGSPLIPPGAQRLVEAALHWARHQVSSDLAIADIGTGCGAVALALAALEPRFTHVYAVDESVDALAVAQSTGARYLLNLVINWFRGEGLDVVPEPVDLIVCSQIDQLSPLAGGGHSAGAESVSSQNVRLLAQAPAKLRPGGALICVVDDTKRSAASEALMRSGFTALVWADSHGDGPAIAVAQIPGKVAGEGVFGLKGE